ncbi:MAG: hypothetical protein ACYC9O_05520 [Candidatus Latescibacterota bacterium]
MHVLLNAVFFVGLLSFTTSPVSGQAANYYSPPGFSEDFFPVFPCDPQHGYRSPFIEKRIWGLGSMKDANYTMGGFVRPQDLPECEKLGIAAIMLLDTGLRSAKLWKNLSDAQIDSIMKKLVTESGKSTAIYGYHITDEPGATCFPALAKAVAAVKKYAPGKLAYINVYPDYATLGAPNLSQLETQTYTEYLERFVTEVKPQMLSYDNYMVQFSMDMRDKTKAASYYRNLLEVRRIAQKHNIPFWNTLTACQIRPHTTVPSPANLRFQAYTTLAAGGRGVKWYTYYSRNNYNNAPIDKHDGKSPTWYYLREVNHEMLTIGPVMNRLNSTGVYFSAPAPVDSLPLLPGEIVESVGCETPVMVGEFTAKDGSRYIMAVNCSLERSVKCAVKLRKPVPLRLMSPADGALLEVPKDGFWLVAGQGALLKLGN